MKKKILDHLLLAAVYFAVSSKLLSDYTIFLMIEVLQVLRLLHRRPRRHFTIQFIKKKKNYSLAH